MAISDLSDGDIIGASLEEPERFGEIFRRHRRPIFRFAAKRVGVEDAADVVADIFQRAFTIRHRYDTNKPSSLPWLYGIGSNVIGDRLKRAQRSEREYLVGYVAERSDDVTDETDDRIVAQDVVILVNEVLRDMPRKDADTLFLYALEDMTYSEIADALGVPIGTVKSRIARARREILEQIPNLRQRTGLEAPTEPGTENG